MKTNRERTGAKAAPNPLWYVGLGAALVLLILGALVVFTHAMAASRGCVGVMTIDGELATADTPDSLLSPGQVGSQTIADQIAQAGGRDDIKALVVVVNSPGGSVVASHEIYDALKNVSKPKVAYFREVAASGGYYVAMGTDYIVSDPDALTGSIGVKATFDEFSGLMVKLGVNETSIQSGALKDIGSPTRPMTDQEKAIMQGVVDEAFVEFRDVVNTSRGTRLNQTAFAQVLDARVLTGRQAQAIGLVDALGTKTDAIAKASQMAGQSDLPVCNLDNSQPGLISRLLGQTLGSVLPRASAGGWSLNY